MVRRRGGYTLPELAVTTAILGLLALVVAPMFIQTMRFFVMNRTRVELQRDARSAMAIVTRNLRQAVSSSITIDHLAGEPYYSRISFTRIGGTPLTYTQSGTRLVETQGTKTMVLTEDLRFMNFYFPRSDDMTIVSVSMTLEKAIYEGKKKALHVASEKVRVMD